MHFLFLDIQNHDAQNQINDLNIIEVNEINTNLESSNIELNKGNYFTIILEQIFF